jgi:hypothetical protein
MAKMPPAFLKKVAPAKGGAPAMKGAPSKGKMCPGCKNPACKKAGKCVKGG